MQQQQKQGIQSKTERSGHDSSDESTNDEDQDVANEMNFIDTNYTNTAVHEYEPHEYDGMAEWRLTPGTLSPSPKPLYSSTFGYSTTTSCYPTAMDTGEEVQFTSSPLTREEQATDTSYTMLTSKRDALSTATADGKIQEPHMNDV